MRSIRIGAKQKITGKCPAFLFEAKIEEQKLHYIPMYHKQNRDRKLAYLLVLLFDN